LDLSCSCGRAWTARYTRRMNTATEFSEVMGGVVVMCPAAMERVQLSDDETQ
jgi:hypothetical protein